MDEPKRRGRKRDPARTQAILQAAATQLLEVGYDRFRMQDVAERAGCGTGAIYRRWSSKEALVAEAIRAMPAWEPPLSDDPVADLRVVVRSEVAGHANQPDRVPGLITAMRADEGIRDAVREGYTVKNYRAAIARVVGPDHPQLDLLAELAPAISLLRASFAPETLDADALTDEIVALILCFQQR
jgi:AcrR family transcriptional regulator